MGDHDGLDEVITMPGMRTPHYLAESMVTELLKAYGDETNQIRQGVARRKVEADRLKRQLQELISMRADRLLSDDEFKTQREHLKGRLFGLQATGLNYTDESLTETETGELADVLSDLATAWRTMPVESRRGFGDLLFPAGYVFQRVRTAETGLLFKTFGTYDGRTSGVVDLIKENSNTIFAEIRKLLALVRPITKPEKKAA